MPTTPNVRFAVIGIGAFAKERVLPGLRRARNAEPVAIVTSSPDKAERIREQYGLPYAYTYKELHACLSSDEVDAVYIVLPNSLHRDMTVWAAAYNKHVLCEKPMATSIGDCDEMIAACRQHNVKLMIGYRMQFEPANLRLREIVRSGDLGRIKLIHSTMTQSGQLTGDPHQWRLDAVLSGGGPVADLGVYSINEACWITGEPPDFVRAHAYSSGLPRFREVPETATFTLSFPSYGDVVASCSYGLTKTSWIEVVGEKGRVRLDPAYHYDKGLSLFIEKDGTQHTEPFPRTDQVALEIEHFSRCVTQNLEPGPSGADGRRDRVIIDAIFESSRSGAAVSLAL